MNALLAMLRKKAQALWIWQTVFVAAVAWGFVNGHLAEQTAMQQMRFVAMDSRSTFYLTAAGSFEESKTIHAELARMAAEAIFDRNPGDDPSASNTTKSIPSSFDNPERLERLFNPETTAAVIKDAGRDAETFKLQQIHQHIETGAIKEVNVNSNTALISVDGQILRTGMFNGRVMNDAKRVTIFLKMAVNDSMATNGRYPLVVIDYQEKFE